MIEIDLGNLYHPVQGGYRAVAGGQLARLLKDVWPNPAPALQVTIENKVATVTGPAVDGLSAVWDAGSGGTVKATAGDPSTVTVNYKTTGARYLALTVTDITKATAQATGAVAVQNRAWQANYSTRHGKAAGVKSEWTPVANGDVTVQWEQTGGDPTTIRGPYTVTEKAGTATAATMPLTWPTGESGRRVARVRANAIYPWGRQIGEEFGVVSIPTTQPAAHDAVKVPFSPDGWPYADVTDAPLAGPGDYTGAPTHDALVKDLVDQIKISWYPTGVPAFNAYSFTCAMAIADASTPRYDVTPIRSLHPDQLAGPGYYKNVPIPDHAVASAGTDGHIAIYDPTTDRLWEFWQFQWLDKNTPMAAWGGRIDNVSQSDAAFPAPFGVSASGLAFPAMAVTIAEASEAKAEAAAGRTTKGAIQHALYLATIFNAGRACWPANRYDGGNGGKLMHGQRVRLAASVDVDALNAHPLAKAIAHALQKYGAVMSDTAGQVNIGAESGMGAALRDDTNPWAALESPLHDWDLLTGIPWERLEVIQAGWRPTPASPSTPVAVTQQRFVPFTASNGASATYHVWSGRNVGDPVLIWLHGDAAFEHANPDSTHVFAGSGGVVKACVDRGITVVSALTPDVSGTQTWWEDSSRNVTYLADLIAKLKADLQPSRIYLGGYSGGAQFATQYFIPQKSALLGSGGSMVYGGGGKPVTPSSPTFTSTFRSSWWMDWTTGADDTAANSAENYDGLAYAQAGADWYRAAGFEVGTSWPAGIDHDTSTLFGGWVAGSLDRHPGR